MNDRGSEEQNGSNAEDLLALEAICSEFESDWSCDSISRIADLVIHSEDHLQNALVSELTSIDLELRQSRSEPINPEEYLLRLPGFADEINATIEDFRQSQSPVDVTRQHKSSGGLIGDDEFEAEGHSSSLRSAPSRIGDYQIVRRIGSGGVGVVYEGIQESLGRRVAIKTLSQGHLSSQVSRFRREAKAIAMLHHTNIVEVFGSGIHDSTPYFAMQLIDGQNLAEVIDAAKNDHSNSVGVHCQREVAKIGVQVARALQHAHEQGVLHRDIKPSNLLLDENGTTWVTDFGMAKLADDKSKHAKTAGVFGTIRYIPPEGFSGQWDERSDVYSLGLTLYELLVLRPVFEGDDFNQLVKTISSVHSPTHHAGRIEGGARDLETIIFKAVEREPHRRYSSAGELADELQRYLDGVPIKARPVSTMEKTLRWAKRSPAAAGLSALTLLVAFVGLPIVLWLWLQSSSALRTVEAQQQSIEDGRRDAEAARYGSTTLLVQNYIDRGMAQQATRALDGLIENSDGNTPMESWEFKFLKQSLDASQKTFRDDALVKKEFSVWQVVPRPDDSQIATIHSLEAAEAADGKVILWDTKTGEQQHVLGDHGSSVFGCAYSNDGRRLATVGFVFDNPKTRGTLCTWDVETGKRISKIDLPGEFEFKLINMYSFPRLPGVAFSRDDKLTVTWPGPVEVRRCQTQEVVWDCQGRYALVLPDDRLLVYTGSGIEIRELSSGEIVDEFSDRRLHNLAQFKLSKDGKHLSCVGVDRMLVWNSIDRLNEFQTTAVPGIYWGTISPAATHIVYSARKGELTMKNLDQSIPNPPRSLLGHQGTVNHGCFSRNGDMLLTGGVDGSVKFWPLNPKQRVAETVLNYEKMSNFCFNEGGDQIHYVGRRLNPHGKLFNAGTIVTEDMEEFAKKEIETTYRADWPRSDFAFSHDRKLMAAPVSEPGYPAEIRGHAQVGNVGIWECESWEKGSTIEAGFSHIHAVGWHSSDELIAIAGDSDGRNSVKIFSTQSEDHSLVGELEIEDVIVTLAFDESRLAVSSGGKISVFAFETMLEDSSAGSRIEFHKLFDSKEMGEFVCLDFSPDGTRLASADKQHDNLNVFDVESGLCLYQQPGPRAFCCVQFSPCGNRLALSGYDSIVHLCDANSGYRLLQLSGPDPAPGTAAINSRVVFSPEGRRIATNTWQGKIRFWEIEDVLVE